MEQNSIPASDSVLENSQFLEFEQEFCFGLFGNVSWNLYLPEYIIQPLLAIWPDYFARIPTLY